MSDIIDYEKEIERLNQELKKNTAEVERLEKKLSNPGFIAKAPEAVIAGEKEKLAKYTETLEKVKAALKKLQK